MKYHSEGFKKGWRGCTSVPPISTLERQALSEWKLLKRRKTEGEPRCARYLFTASQMNVSYFLKDSIEIIQVSSEKNWLRKSYPLLSLLLLIMKSPVKWKCCNSLQ